MTAALSTRNIALLEGVHVDFSGVDAVCHVDLAIDSAALTALTGPNGAGKSTLLEVIAGVRAPSVGHAVRHTRSVAFVPQRTVVSARLPVTVRDVVTVGAWGRGRPWARLSPDDIDAVDRAMHLVGLTALARTPFAALSGGQQQRALLAQGLARDAELLLLDEPTTALDAESSSRVRQAIAHEVERGVGVVCVTHDPLVVQEADRVVRMKDGRVVADSAV